MRDCLGYALTPEEQPAPVEVSLFQRGRALYVLTFNTYSNGGFAGDTGRFERLPTPIP